MSKKRICILSEWYLPGTKAGGPVRSIFSLISILKSEFDFYLITTDCDLGSQTPYASIKSNEWFETEGVNYYYLSKNNLNKERIKNLLTQLNADVVYLNSFWSYWFSIFIVRLKMKNEIKGTLVLAPRGMLGKGALSIKPYKKKIYIALSKARKFYTKVLFHATNQGEKNDIEKYYPGSKIIIAENANNTIAGTFEKTKKVNELNLFFLSRIAKVKNLHFALNVLSKIPKEYQVNYSIYGNIEDANYWKHCLAIIETLPKNITVNYKGELSFDEIQNKISAHHFLFLPTLNENYGHSIVESLLSACPAIISDQTPWKELEKNNAGYSLSLKNEKAFVDTIINCAKMEQNDYKKMTEDAIKYMSKKIDLPLLKKKYLQLFNTSE